jgi:hypothetical protein
MMILTTTINPMTKVKKMKTTILLSTTITMKHPQVHHRRMKMILPQLRMPLLLVIHHSPYLLKW